MYGSNATGWDIEHLLSSIYILFKNTPARRHDYQTVTSSTIFPMKFCKHRWVENVPVVQRALEIWENIRTYVDCVQKKKLPDPKTKSFQAVKEAMNDKLLTAKLQFFLSVAKQVTPFLTKYQSDKPMLPFLASDLHHIMRDMMDRVVKSSIMENTSTRADLINLDLKNDNLKGHKQVDLGFSAENTLKKLKLSDLQIMDYRMKARSMIVAILIKLQNKCPLKYSLVRNLDFLDPRMMINRPKAAQSNLKKVLNVMVQARKVNENECDDILKDYKAFTSQVSKFQSELFKEFDPDSERLDKFLHKSMNNGKHNILWGVVKKLLILSHGQASVERGFSINRQCEADNLGDMALVARRVITDHIAAVGGVLNVKLTKTLLVSCTFARQKYHAYLAEAQRKRKDSAVSEEEKKRKRDEEKETLLRKKRKLEEQFEALNEALDQY